VQLPDEAWQTIHQYLHASGRWDGMHAAKYIFVPLAAPGREVTGNQAEDWIEGRPLSTQASQDSLKLYGTAACIPGHKLILAPLRDSVIRRKLDQGESLEGMQLFFNAKKVNCYLRYRLDCLKNLPRPSGTSVPLSSNQAQPPGRAGKFLKGDETITHGYYVRKHNKEAIEKLIAENICGMEQEIVCLREMMRRMLERNEPHAILLEVYSRASRRLAEILSAKQSQQQDDAEARAMEKLEQMVQISSKLGGELSRQQVLDNAAQFANPAQQKVLEEIATLRLLLRSVYKWS
jgi:hypothetical protein